ncbi:hypothetical protein KC686_03305 [Candidatus Woesebacteria bacterium]|nr:hypothetical protein [Candidatus Woesebacteria bacterium]
MGCDMIKMALYKAKRPYHFMKTGVLNGWRAQMQLGFPEKNIIVLAVTGTDGKTTSATMLYEVLKAAGKKVALLTTVAAYIGDEAIDTGFHVTSPQPRDLLTFIKRMEQEGYDTLVLEVTSHGLYQYRTWGITPRVAGITNLTHEHLDYHLKLDEYAKAKSLILSSAQTAVLNADDEQYKLVKKYVRSKRVQTYSMDTELPLSIKTAIATRFPEPFNQLNARLVYSMAREVGVHDEQYIKGITQFTGIPGRVEKISVKKPYQVYVDFAHTPNGLKHILSHLRQPSITKGKLICIVGCASKRDTSKRPIMGQIAASGADIAIFTAEDPREEDVWSIIRQMKENLGKNYRNVISIADRGEAIAFAMNTLAQKGDTIVVCGKGHEQSMCYGRAEYPWNDADAIRSIASGTLVYSNPEKRNE